MVGVDAKAINVCGVVGVDGTSCCKIASCGHLVVVVAFGGASCHGGVSCHDGVVGDVAFDVFGFVAFDENVVVDGG